MYLPAPPEFPKGTYAHEVISTTGLPAYMPPDDLKVVELEYRVGFHRQADRHIRCYAREAERLHGGMKARWCESRLCTLCAERIGSKWLSTVESRLSRMSRPETVVLSAPVMPCEAAADHVFPGVDGVEWQRARYVEERIRIEKAFEDIATALRRLQQNKRLAKTKGFAVIEISNSVGRLPFPHVHLVMDCLTDFRTTIVEVWERWVPNGRVREEARPQVRDAGNFAHYLAKPITASVDVYRLNPVHFEGVFRAIEDRSLFRSIAGDE